jgi:molybdate/tungstate transport system permease protein
MAVDTDAPFGFEGIGRTPLVAAFVAGQALAFAATYAIGRPTWYAYVVVVSTMGTAYALEHGRVTARAAVRFLAVQALAFALAYAAGSLLGLVAGVDVSGVGHPIRYVGYVALGTAGAVLSLEEGGFTVTTATLGSVLLVALGLPLILFVARQSPALVVETALDSEVHRVLYLGVYGPLLAALASLLFGVPLAHLLARGFAGQQFVESLVDLPLVVPHSVAGIIVLFGFGRGGAFPGFPVLGTMVGLVLALAFVGAPYAVNASREAFETIDDRLEYAARIHGANRWETFRRVTAPLAVRGIVTGGVLAWARAVSEFGAVAVVAYSVSFFYPPAGRTVTAQHAPVFVYNTYLQGGLAESGAVAFLLLVVSAVIFLVVRYVTDGNAVTGGMP